MINGLLNVLWLILGGLWMAIGWWIAGLVLAITIIGLPWARSCFVLGSFALWPFGRMAVPRDRVNGRHDLGTGPLGVVGNVIWLILAGWWLALGHLASAIANFVTIIGIPFGFQHLKLALIALAPVGQTVVDRDDPRLQRVPRAVARTRSA